VGRDGCVIERFEASPLGRVLLSAFLVVVLVSVVVVNLPASKLRSTASDATEPVIDVLGLNQNWNVFAPDPRRQSLGLRARVTFADGTTSTWKPYVGGNLVGHYRDYRWGKWMENVRLDQNRGLWPGLASWVARHESHGRRVSKVVLIRRWRDLHPPGAKANEGPQRSYLFYTWRPAA
jgi:hypothetical protein